MIAVIWEVWNDRKGDLDKRLDVVVRGNWVILESIVLNMMFDKPILICVLLSIAFFFLTFDYLMAYVLIQNKVIQGHWFSYQSKSGVVDNIKFWKGLNPWVKLLVRLIFLITALLIFIL